MEETGLKIKLIAAFKGLKFMPHPFVIGTNNANPKLILKKDDIEYRNLLFTTKKTYEQIEQVDVYLNSFKIFGVTTTNICLSFKDTAFTFVGNLNDMEKLKELVKYFKARGMLLSKKAEKLISEENNT